MIPAALLGFSVGTVIAWWVVLRSLSHGAAELEDDPLDTVQWDPYVQQVTRHLFIDCE